MNYTLNEWLNLAVRWFHVFAGILWIGATWYFTWLDRRFHTSDPDEVWMVHSGGFYRVEKVSRPASGHTLHWFKWEAALTALSGTLLLIIVYYFGGLMPERHSIAIGVAFLVVTWFFYDLVLARDNRVAMIGGWVLIMAATYGLDRVMSPRAAFMHVGAAMGWMMAANVWARILPAQRQMVRMATEGGEPDQRLAAQAKNRSKHNTFLIMPVLLVMISNHFPIATYGSPYNWLILGGLTIVGWIAAHIVRTH
ncbi:MAG TPA: urate hydroxylase PuuD [Thermoanaerobaculia bacterium]|nr:urate hydroxylase PuuD [Thermoanaerobaculia bacterium]